jgi:hypothetical protein
LGPKVWPCRRAWATATGRAPRRGDHAEPPAK